MTVPAGDHVAARPSWDCSVDGEPWPCLVARGQLVASLGRTQLAMFMWLNLEEAAGDMPHMNVAVFYERFIAWTRRPAS